VEAEAGAHELGIDGIVDAVLIGQGGFGTVYRATEVAFDRTVAVKVFAIPGLDSETRRTFDRECRALGSLSWHPNIVTVHRAGVAQGRPFLIMEYLPGGAIAERLPAHPLHWQEAIAIGIKLGGALTTAHAAGVFHRDIKPENVLMTAYSEPLLADFGVARIEGGTRTTPGVITGSIKHAAPEVLSGIDATAAADIWALASTLHALMAGDAPFERADDESLHPLITRILTAPPSNLRPLGVPDAVATVIECGLAKDTWERPESALAFAEQLQEVERGLGLAATPMVTPPSHSAPIVAETGASETDRATTSTPPRDGQEREPRGISTTVRRAHAPAHDRTDGVFLKMSSPVPGVPVADAPLRRADAPRAADGSATSDQTTAGVVHGASRRVAPPADGPASESDGPLLTGRQADEPDVRSAVRRVLTTPSATRMKGLPAWPPAPTGARDDSARSVPTESVAPVGAARSRSSQRWRWLIPGVIAALVITGAVFAALDAIGSSPDRVRWRFDAGQPINCVRGPAIAGGLVIFTSQDLSVRAVVAKTGTLRWKVQTGAAITTGTPFGTNLIFSSPAVAGDTVYVGAQDGIVRALSLADGRTRWQFKTSAKVQSSPAVADGTVFVGANNGRLYALDAATGRPRWTVTLGDVVFSSPAAADGIVVAASGNGSVFALDSTTGAVRWRVHTGAGIFSSPSIEGDAVYVGSNDHKLYALRLHDGAPLWTFTTEELVSSSPAVGGGMVFVGGFDKRMHALDAASGRERWTFATGDVIFSSPKVSNGVVYVGSFDRRVYALDAASGIERWNFATGAIVGASPTVSGGSVYVGSDDGFLYALAA
jgi:outer membrane protein assembly factor BamB/tRNA A-37 threonylcarbamoyl transferase component Bud32